MKSRYAEIMVNPLNKRDDQISLSLSFHENEDTSSAYELFIHIFLIL